MKTRTWLVVLILFSASLEISSPQADAGSPFRLKHWTGYLSIPRAKTDSPDKYPGILMVPDYWGLDKQVRLEAENFADNQYIALATDFYAGKNPTSLTEANRWNEKLLLADQMKILDEGLSALQKRPHIDRLHLAVVGWGTGANVALRFAENHPEIKAVVMYYGGTGVMTDDLQKFKGALLAIFGEKDPSLLPGAVKDFEEKLKSLHMEHTVKLYPDSTRCFADSTRDDYNVLTGPQAHALMLQFLSKYLRLVY